MKNMAIGITTWAGKDPTEPLTATTMQIYTHLALFLSEMENRL